MAESVLRYDPGASITGGEFAFRNGVRLHGPVEVTPDVASKAGLPAGMTAGYYAGIVEGGPAGPARTP
jgi:hypothetical protein